MELKPCPFCGGEARIIEAEIGMFEDGYAVYCGGTCGVKMGVDGRLGEAYKWTPYFSTEAEAIEAWNTRAERTCQMTEIFCGTASGIEWVCSECGSTCFVSEPLDTDEQPRYCPNCGAKVVE